MEPYVKLYIQVPKTPSKVSTFLRYMGFPIERLIVH